MTDSISELNNYKGICKTAPGTPGLLNMYCKFLFYSWCHFVTILVLVYLRTLSTVLD